jgi:hypothetical protein
MESAILKVKNDLEKKLLVIEDFKSDTKSCMLIIIVGLLNIINYLECKLKKENKRNIRVEAIAPKATRAIIEDRMKFRL